MHGQKAHFPTARGHNNTRHGNNLRLRPPSDSETALSATHASATEHEIPLKSGQPFCYARGCNRGGPTGRARPRRRPVAHWQSAFCARRAAFATPASLHPRCGKTPRLVPACDRRTREFFDQSDYRPEKIDRLWHTFVGRRKSLFFWQSLERAGKRPIPPVRLFVASEEGQPLAKVVPAGLPKQIFQGPRTMDEAGRHYKTEKGGKGKGGSISSRPSLGWQLHCPPSLPAPAPGRQYNCRPNDHSPPSPVLPLIPFLTLHGLLQAGKSLIRQRLTSRRGGFARTFPNVSPKNRS